MDTFLKGLRKFGEELVGGGVGVDDIAGSLFLPKEKKIVLKKFRLRYKNLVQIDEDSNEISFLKISDYIKLNIPLTASICGHLPFNTDLKYYEFELNAKDCEITFGVGNLTFPKTVRPGDVPGSIGWNVKDRKIKKNGEVTTVNLCSVEFGDKLGCGITFIEDSISSIQFFKNHEKIADVKYNGEESLYPIISMSSTNSKIKLTMDEIWKKMSRLSFSSSDKRVVLASHEEPLKENVKSHVYFTESFKDVTIVIDSVMEKGSEVCLGIVPSDWSERRAPGGRLHSIGYNVKAKRLYISGKEIKVNNPNVVIETGDEITWGLIFDRGKRHFFLKAKNIEIHRERISKSFPEKMFACVNLSSSKGGSVSVKLAEESIWKINDKTPLPDLTYKYNIISGNIEMNKDYTMASLPPQGLSAVDSFLTLPKSVEHDIRNYFEIALCFGQTVSIGLTKCQLSDHPGLTDDSIGYHCSSGLFYKNQKVIQEKPVPSSFGDRIGCGVEMEEGSQIVYFTRNSHQILRINYGHHNSPLFPAIGMRTFGAAPCNIKLLKDSQRFFDYKADEGETASAADASDQKTGLYVDDSMFECPICMNIFEDPRMLPCLSHTFCLSCLSKYVQEQATNKMIKCPICSISYNLPEGKVSCLPKNTFVAQLLDIRRAQLKGSEMKLN